jgi:hypothetical protein
MVLLGICAAIAAISGACAAVVKFWRFAHAQSDKNATTLEEFETYLASDKRRIENLERKQDKADEQNKLILKALVKLMSHELDGNHTKELADVRDEIQDFLIKK